MRRTPSGQGPARRPGARPSVRGTAGRSANRPALARRAAASGAAKRTPAPQPSRFTGRATVLVVIFVALALGYTYPVRVYLTQQSDIAQVQSAQAAQRGRIGDLTEQVAKWQDDEYVRIQARRRLFYVQPGEIPLVVLRPGAGDAHGAGPNGAGPTPAKRPPWYATLWSSIRAADERANP
ncbi:MAG TPA: septum formation initiator family protein [Micromonosporaceae bacterium]